MPDALPNEFVVFDVETTGLDPAKGDEVIEIGAQKIRGREVVGEFTKFVKPTRPVPAESMRVHGITNEQLTAEGISAADAVPAFVEFVGSAILVAHNAPFDVGFINAHLKKLNRPPLTNAVVDTIEIAKRYLILASYSLKNVAAFLKVPQPEAHRALVDVITTREVFFKLIDRAKGKV